MITPETKAMAIAQLKRGFQPDAIANALQIPEKLVREWSQGIKGDDLVSLTANLHAAQELAEGKVTLNGELLKDTEAVLKTKLEAVAVEVVDQTSLVVETGDLVRAKTLQLCADTVAKLYATFIIKGQPINPGAPQMNGKGMTVFQALMRD